MIQNNPINPRDLIARKVEKLHGRLIETSLWYASVSTPLVVEVSPAVRRRLMEASRLLHLATEAVEIAAQLSDISPEEVRRMLDIEDGLWDREREA